MRKVDKLGRVVIPVYLRERYGIEEESTMEFLDTGDGILMRVVAPSCKVCHGQIPNGASLPLCDECLAAAVKLYRDKENEAN